MKGCESTEEIVEIFKKVERVREEKGQRDVAQNYSEEATAIGDRNPQRGNRQSYSDVLTNTNDRRSNSPVRQLYEPRNNKENGQNIFIFLYLKTYLKFYTFYFICINSYKVNLN